MRINKKYILILCMASTIYITWCSQTYTSQITFDKYSITLNTTSTGFYEIQNKNNLNEEKIFVPYNTTWFIDSVLIRRDKDSGISLEKLADMNQEKDKRKLPGFSKKGAEERSFMCGQQEISWYEIAYTIDAITPGETMYFNQYFFKAQDNIYSISTSTQEKSKNKQFNNAIKSLQCNQ